MTTARKNLIDPASTPYYHCMARCVRRAFLCGKDEFSGKNYEHRRQWVVDRLKTLAEVFAIEVCAYAVMSNHYQAELQRVEEFAEQYRSRLMDISWFMRCLNEHLARGANKEDDCKGRFWEGRYQSQALLDEAALLTCMAYVDLNPVRAKMAKTPETSDFTSIQERAEIACGDSARKQVSHLKPLRSQGQNPDIAIPFALSSYLELVDWTGRIVRQDKRGSIPADIPPVLERLKIDPDEWLKTMSWNNRFRRAVGKLAALKAYAEKVGRQWVHGIGSSQSLYLQ